MRRRVPLHFDGMRSALHRIVASQETGLVVELVRLFGVYSYFDDPRQHGIIILYLARVVSGTLQAGDDADDVAFFSKDALPPARQIGFASHRRALQEWCESVDCGGLSVSNGDISRLWAERQ